MKILVTCGPSYEPIDEVRRLTNFSTGELGVMLADALARAGHEVACLKGSGATFPGPRRICRLQSFNTNDDLLELLQAHSVQRDVGAVFHVAALCDYRIKQVRDEAGHECRSAKIASRTGALTLELEPATKVIHELRALFPDARLIGWKYELAGTREEAEAKAWRQIKESRTDACVLNGRANGSAFSFCQAAQSISEFHGKTALVTFLCKWLENHAPAESSTFALG